MEYVQEVQVHFLRSLLQSLRLKHLLINGTVLPIKQTVSKRLI